MLQGIFRFFCNASATSTEAVSEVQLSTEDLFLQAISQGNLENTKKYLAELLQVERDDNSHTLSTILRLQSDNGWTALQLAAANNFEDIVHYLLELVEINQDNGANEGEVLTKAALINDPGSTEGITSLALAIANRCDSIAAYFLTIPDVNVSDDKCTLGKGRNIVYAICRDGLLSLAKLVVEHFGKEMFISLVKGKDANGLNGLHAAALMKKAEMSKYILEIEQEIAKGCSDWTFSTTRDGSNALHFACRYQRKSYLTNISDINSCEEKAKVLDEIEHRMKETVQILLNYFKSIKELKTVFTAADVFGSTPLHVACLHGSSLALSSILQVAYQQQDATSWLHELQDNDGHHPTHSAAQHLSMLANQLQQQSQSSSNTTTDEETQSTRWLFLREVEDTKACLLMLLLPSSEITTTTYPVDARDYSDFIVMHLLCSNPQSNEILNLMQDSLLPGLVAKYGKDKLSSLLIDYSASSGWNSLQQCVYFLSTATKDMLSQQLVDETKTAEEVSVVMKEAAPMLSLLLSYIPSSPLCKDLELMKPKAEADAKKYKYRCGAHNRLPITVRQSILQNDYSIHGIAQYLQSIVANNRTPRIAFLLGAGVSTAAGIPDFRSSTGLYSSNQDRTTRNMFSTEAVLTRPSAFYRRVKRLFLPVIDHKILPTGTHAMLRLLKEMGWLQRIYTQNVDLLEYQALEANLDHNSEEEIKQKELEAEDSVVECHGSFKRAYCTNPQCNYKVESTKQAMENEFWSVIRSIDDSKEEEGEEPANGQGVYPRCKLCSSVLRPDVTFFGEPLPLRFSLLSNEDIPSCDLMIIAGTTLLVYPVASLPSFVNPHCVRLLVNRDPAGPFRDVTPCNVETAAKVDSEPKQYETSMYRDVFYQGDCDNGMIELAKELGIEGRLSKITAALKAFT